MHMSWLQDYPEGVHSSRRSADCEADVLRCICPGCSITPRECTAVGAMPCRCFAICILAKPIHIYTRAKIIVTKESPVEDLTVVTLLRTDTTLDHSQKAEKVCNGTWAVCVDCLANVYSSSSELFWCGSCSSCVSRVTLGRPLAGGQQACMI